MENAELTRLYSYLGKRFDAFDEGFDRVEKYVEGRFGGVDSRLDAIIGHIEDHEIELVAIKSQLSRHERWNHIIAKKTDTKIDY